MVKKIDRNYKDKKKETDRAKALRENLKKRKRNN
tara:strand:+ start:1102 stop:1203 length:102 start_codon:yes stop_codon:yes gene_type:complete